MNFTVSWPGEHGEWQVACTATTPAHGTSDTYTCAWNRSQAQAPDGPIQVSFDVYDVRGNVNDAPNGLHAGMLRQ